MRSRKIIGYLRPTKYGNYTIEINLSELRIRVEKEKNSDDKLVCLGLVFGKALSRCMKSCSPMQKVEVTISNRKKKDSPGLSRQDFLNFSVSLSDEKEVLDTG